MGKLLDILKQQNIDLNNPATARDELKQTKIKGILSEYVCRLPVEKKSELLSEYISPQVKEEYGKLKFSSMAKDIVDQGDDALRTFLTDKNTFGKSCEEILPDLERRLGSWAQKHYEQAKILPNASAEDKLVFLCGTVSMRNRLDYLWDYVGEDQKLAYQNKVLPDLAKDPNLFAQRMKKPGTLAEGKDWNKLAEAIEANMDEDSLNEAAKRISEVKVSDEELLRTQLDQIALSPEDQNTKRQLYLQNSILEGDAFEFNDFKKKLGNEEKWLNQLSPTKTIDRLNRNGSLDLPGIVARSKQYLDTLKDDSTYGSPCKNAVLQNYRELQLQVPAEMRSSDAYREMSQHAAELQADKVMGSYLWHKANVDSSFSLLEREIQTIEKVKSGWFLSTTNSPEHDRMTRSLRLFNAKKDMVLGKSQSVVLSEEEQKIVEESDIKELYDNAKRDTFNYSCLKTKNGTGSIIHTDGVARNDSAQNAYNVLRQIGTRLGLSDSIASECEDMRLQTLKSRSNKAWVNANAENYAAKTIYAMSLKHSGVPADKQDDLLRPDKMDAQLAEIKNRPAFKKMVSDLGTKGLCDAIIKGEDALTLAYSDAQRKLADPNAKKSKAPASISAQQQREFWNKEGEQPQKKDASPISLS